LYNCVNFEFLQKNFELKNNAHSYLFYTNDFLSCKNDVLNLIKYLFKNDNLKSLENDLVIINKCDKKIIQKEDILKVKNLIFNTSYINDKRIYIIEEAHKLNSTSANMILKFLEEPSDNIIAIFITTNLDLVLPTIKSRCQIINAFYETTITYFDEDLNIMLDFLNKNKYISIFDAKNNFKKYARNDLIVLFKNYANYLSQKVYEKDNYIMLKKINKVLKLLNNNVSVDYVFDVLFLEGDL